MSSIQREYTIDCYILLYRLGILESRVKEYKGKTTPLPTILKFYTKLELFLRKSVQSLNKEEQNQVHLKISLICKQISPLLATHQKTAK
jgi:hypothetical protein